MKIKAFLEKHKYISVLLALVVFFIVVKIIFPTPVPKTPPVFPTPLPTPTISYRSNWKNIYPGITPLSEIESKLGKPSKTKMLQNEIVYSYPSENKNWPDQVFVSKENNQIVLIKTYFPKENYDYFTNRYGQSDKEMFGPHSQAGFSTFIFSNEGLAIVAEKKSKKVLEVWYFRPADIENFLQTIGKDLQSNPPEQF